MSLSIGSPFVIGSSKPIIINSRLLIFGENRELTFHCEGRSDEAIAEYNITLTPIACLLSYLLPRIPQRYRAVEYQPVLRRVFVRAEIAFPHKLKNIPR